MKMTLLLLLLQVNIGALSFEALSSGYDIHEIGMIDDVFSTWAPEPPVIETGWRVDVRLLLELPYMNYGRAQNIN